ncbi:transporter [Acinetobacter larvae]|uniref:Transporter n=1 Tax=Acinetobacter larvae TaxID=1789224 RepID=A0A1B2M396_9GAMM|nr:transporter [Acinetobacter larvae]AOA59668.1 hypothetical protein BFG52_15800 [Acinetobacter larvae]
MKLLQKTMLLVCCSSSMAVLANDFSFDRPGTGFGTGITPVGRLAWEQSLPSVNYQQSTLEGDRQKNLTLNGDVLLRTGLASGLELQLGWDGPAWSQTKYRGQTHEKSGNGDVSIALKKAIDLNDDKMSMAVLARAQIATGNDEFSAHDDIYTVGSSLDYKFNDLVNTGISMYYEVQNSDWSVTAVPNINYKIAGKLSGFSEFVYRKQESQAYQYSLGQGLIYSLNDRAQLDASIAVQLNGDDRDYKAGLGFAYLF